MNLTRKVKYVLISINVIVFLLLIGFNVINTSFFKTVSHRVEMTEFVKDTRVAKKVVFKEDQAYHSAKFQLNVQFFPELDVYDNIFQLGAEPTTFRVEVSPHNTLSAIIGYENANRVEVYKIEDSLRLNTWHTLEIRGTKDGEITILLDDEMTNRIDDPKVDFRINDVVVGAGYDSRRGFSGVIKDFSITYTLFGTSWLLNVVDFISEYYAAILILQILGLAIILQRKETLHVEREDFEGLAKSFVLVIFLNLLPILALSDPTDIPGWILAMAFLSLPVVLANENKYFSYFLSAVAIVICIFLFISSQTSFGLLLLASFSVVAGLTLLENRSWMVQTLLALLIVFSWALISPFNVYFYISKFMETNAKYFVISFLASFVLCWNYVFGERKELAALSKSALLLYGVGIVSVFLLSFRNDFIFAGSGEPRWEYVIEIIRELKNGSTMLWDVPAQHGLLNFYLASLLPMTEGTAFYLLNALLLFIVATLFMMTFISPRRNWQANLFLFLLTISTLFFTNPHFLEPYPYRGATIMRFFWCYLILFFIFNRFKVKQLGARSTYLGLTCVWLLGSFWSLESAFYCSSIFGVFLIASCVFIFDYDWRKLIGWVAASIGALLAMLAILSASYKMSIGHFPDWLMYDTSQFFFPGGYEKKFSDLIRISWLVAAFYAVLVWACIQCLRNREHEKLVVFLTLFAAFWAANTHFLVSSAANNLNSILPLACFIVLISFELWTDVEGADKHTISKILVMPFFVLSILGGIGSPDFWSKLGPFSMFSKITTISDSAEQPLQDLMDHAQISPSDNIIHYGFPSGMPQWQYQGIPVSSRFTWGIDPTVMLGESILPEIQRKIWSRHPTIVHGDTYWIQTKGGEEDRAATWLDLISKTYKMDSTFENKKYRIIHFSSR